MVTVITSRWFTLFGVKITYYRRTARVRSTFKAVAR